MTDHGAFIAERLTGIGGSDCSSMFNVGYGCSLRLWREKRGEPEDFPREESGPMAIGNLLEAYFIEHYQRITERKVDRMDEAFRMPSQPEVLAHVDGRILPVSGKVGCGVLEVKTVGRQMYFQIKRSGLPEDYILQLQHGMLATDLLWGSFAIGCRDIGISRDSDLLWWDVDRDETLCEPIKAAAIEFWGQVKNGPMPDALPPDDSRCQNCSYRTSCQGSALMRPQEGSEYVEDESLRPLMLQHQDRYLLYREAKGLIEETKEEIKALLGDRTMVSSGGFKMQYYSFTKKAYTVKEHDERPLRIYAPKEVK